MPEYVEQRYFPGDQEDRGEWIEGSRFFAKDDTDALEIAALLISITKSIYNQNRVRLLKIVYDGNLASTDFNFGHLNAVDRWERIKKLMDI